MIETAAKHLGNEVAALPAESKHIGRRIIFFAAVFFIGQLLLIYFFGTKKQNIPLAVTNAPRFKLTAGSDEIIALSNPTLFALPHAHDFSAKIWTVIPTPNTPDFRWHEPPHWLLLDPKNLGAVLKDYLQTNADAGTPLNFKSEPELEVPNVAVEVFFPTNSSLQIGGALAQRKLLTPINPPTLAMNDVIAPSRVQLLVAPDGTVVSTVLLDSCGYADVIKPDQLALQIANAAQFAPAGELMFGEMLFKWHTEPVANTNAPENKIKFTR